MREIKFRAWDGVVYRPLQNSMLDKPRNYLVSFDGILYENDAPTEDSLKEKDWILEQFTGLLDKNATEIYESDYIEDPNYPGDSECLVAWRDGAFYALATDDQEDGGNDLLSEYAEAAVVVGNIHERGEG